MNTATETKIDYDRRLRDAVWNLMQVKGRHHSEIAYKHLEDAYMKAVKNAPLDQQRPAKAMGDAQILEALQTGLECAQEVAQHTHDALKGYKPHRHAAVDADVRQIEAAIAILAAQADLSTPGAKDPG
ncbi:hypothetical protein ACFQAT_07895 [Undibacterium arcticum]|uniref:Uncharacterized protein n=1 Tax=Undibacterium arcticum TaxID=1762892 RepID=A0ABV7F0A3_9BURK